MTNDINHPFIKTTDPEVAAQLRKAGLTEVTETGTTGFTFLNTTKDYAVADVDATKLSFSKQLNL